MKDCSSEQRGQENLLDNVNCGMGEEKKTGFFIGEQLFLSHFPV